MENTYILLRRHSLFPFPALAHLKAAQVMTEIACRHFT